MKAGELPTIDTDLIISDGSANLYFVNPDDFKLKSTKQVTDNIGPVNESTNWNTSMVMYMQIFTEAIYRQDRSFKWSCYWQNQFTGNY